MFLKKIQSNGSLDKLKLVIVVRGDLHNKDLIGDTWSPRASKMTLKYLLEYAVNVSGLVLQKDRKNPVGAPCY